MEEILKKIIYPAILFSTLTLAACGGGGGGGNNSNPDSGGQPQNPDSVAAKLVTSAQTIDYYGDSTVYGWATQSTQVDTTAPEAFAAALQNSALHTVNNKGFNGQTACELLNGVNQEHNWEAEMAQSAATVVILNHGINDAVSGDGQYRSCLTSLAQIAKTEGKRVVFETPNPIDTQVDLLPYVQAMREVAAAEGLYLIDQYAYLNQRYSSDIGSILRDTLHPTDPIYIEKGQYAASEFNNFNR
jgi:hypothetical protein